MNFLFYFFSPKLVLFDESLDIKVDLSLFKLWFIILQKTNLFFLDPTTLVLILFLSQKKNESLCICVISPTLLMWLKIWIERGIHNFFFYFHYLFIHLYLLMIKRKYPYLFIDKKGKPVYHFLSFIACFYGWSVLSH